MSGCILKNRKHDDISDVEAKNAVIPHIELTNSELQFTNINFTVGNLKGVSMNLANI